MVQMTANPRKYEDIYAGFVALHKAAGSAAARNGNSIMWGCLLGDLGRRIGAE